MGEPPGSGRRGPLEQGSDTTGRSDLFGISANGSTQPFDCYYFILSLKCIKKATNQGFLGVALDQKSHYTVGVSR